MRHKNEALRKKIAEGAYYSINGEQTPWEDAPDAVRESFTQMGHDVLPFVLSALDLPGIWDAAHFNGRMDEKHGEVTPNPYKEAE